MSSAPVRSGEFTLAEEFCAERGHVFRDRVDNPPISGLLFRSTKHVVMEGVIDALDTDAPFTFARVIARGRRRGIKVIMLPLPRPVPNMVLLSSTGGVLKRLGVALRESQRLSVEGDFHSRFTLYCPSQYQRDALYVFSPDLLARLVDSADGCDVEIVDNRVLIYAPARAFSKPGQLAELPRLARHLHEKFARQTRRYRDGQRSADQLSDPFLRAQITATAQRTEHGHIVGTVGRRLRTRTTAWQKVGIALGVALALAAALYWVAMVVSALVAES